MLRSQKYDCNLWYPKKQNDRIEQVHQSQGYTVFIKIYVMSMSQNYDCNLWYPKKLNDRTEQVIISRESSLGVCSGAVG
jgi:23S rRNA A2030 N6-methylase RlmJ